MNYLDNKNKYDVLNTGEEEVIKKLVNDYINEKYSVQIKKKKLKQIIKETLKTFWKFYSLLFQISFASKFKNIRHHSSTKYYL